MNRPGADDYVCMSPCFLPNTARRHFREGMTATKEEITETVPDKTNPGKTKDVLSPNFMYRYDDKTIEETLKMLSYGPEPLKALRSYCQENYGKPIPENKSTDAAMIKFILKLDKEKEGKK